ncbi:Hsp20/alpha crystallin family protein [Natronobacterium gregoryi]|uniref:Heat shock protein Hsp20 n=2 Tax=Natronobacterium gregoryi TaxID=44930 RepID=L0AFD3_NATGS|nr:Hsp20/alpha crystallin family protein [Natronobacterium gregoryi]AFZ72603.1 molecular chaperone (small heat shock protein) [Natronobacterium gregoryi SP2]ELY71969.1 heat shock protein Hsp20 [Natronobacterium gregoryi SP2]PLK19203.1 Hsp20/alpha crystallin family protein [Natronobacterium gregoryi SP2]SFJ57451.1 HSP20 family protein [Natronobacterium gregoryi]
MRRNPFDEIEEMLDRVSRQVEEGMTSGGLQVPGSVPADVADTGEEYVVTADLPGYETNDIDLTLSEGTLRLDASREDDLEFAEGEYIRRERTRKTASRRIRLPEPVEEEEVSAGYENGVLTVRLPKVGGVDESKEIDIE